MRQITRTGAFKRDYKRINKADASFDTLLIPVLKLLSSGASLPPKLVDHPLGGNWKSYRDCHLKPDLLLIYKMDKETLTLARLGSHSEIFG